MQAFLQKYHTLHAGNLHTLGEIYRQDVWFIDPAHEIQGLEALIRYFTQLYRHVDSLAFTFAEPVIAGKEGAVRWQMTLTHPRLAGGRPVVVEGMSHLQWDEAELVFYHRDYFDLGALLYEQIPLLGRIIRRLKRGLGQ